MKLSANYLPAFSTLTRLLLTSTPLRIFINRKRCIGIRVTLFLGNVKGSGDIILKKGVVKPPKNLTRRLRRFQVATGVKRKQ